jgi:outer membrane protein assembly factor BamB
MFHREESHSGVAPGSGTIDPQAGPQVLAQYRLFDEPTSQDDLAYLRWTSTLPLADLDGDGAQEIVVTTPDVAPPFLIRRDGQPVPNRVQALKYFPGEKELKVLWSYELTSRPGEAGLDTYSPALADADGDGLPDVIFTSRDGYVRALKGTDGSLIWQFNMGQITEAGPMLGDLDADGIPEVIVATDCAKGLVNCPDEGSQAALYVLPLRGHGEIQPLWKLNYPYKMDSAVPVLAQVENLGKVILAGTWGGELLGVWRTEGGEVRSTALKLTTLDPGIPHDSVPVIRTSPLVDYTSTGPIVVFGWLPTDQDAQDARLSAVRLRAEGGALVMDPAWTIRDLDTWKSSPALVPQPDGHNLIVLGYGLGIGPAPSQSGTVGSCQSEYVFGGVVAVAESGKIVWQQDYGNQEGNLRASAAVADVDGDGRLDVIIPSGCYGKLHAFDALTGTPEWRLQLGPRTQTSPSIGDLVGDGSLEIVLASYDGQVWVLGGPDH